MSDAAATMQQLVSDLALAGAPELRQWVVMAAARGGPDVLALIAGEARRATRLHSLRLHMERARKVGDIRTEDAIRARIGAPLAWCMSVRGAGAVSASSR
jgi:hypothetical protein